ncbi:hypothetical protein DFJ73DRAFT_795744 [Zopfochytrium polystomum]|nr:hypothetical protein DFJ73DRAFT_795744 [Zopfochytrium polystomum]
MLGPAVSVLLGLSGHNFLFDEKSCSSNDAAIQEGIRCVGWLSTVKATDPKLIISIGLSPKVAAANALRKLFAKRSPTPASVFLQTLLAHPSLRQARRPITLDVHFEATNQQALEAALETLHDKFFFAVVGFARREYNSLDLHSNLGGCLMGAQTVTELHLEQVMLGAEFAVAVGQAVSMLPNIRSLTLTILRPHFASFVKFLNSKGENRLQHLEVTLNALHDERANRVSVAESVGVLLRSKRLVSFSLEWHTVQRSFQEAETPVLDALESNPSSPLLSLCLPWVPSDAAVRRLVRTLTRGSNLRRIRLGSDDISVSNFAALLDASPLCKLDVVEAWLETGPLPEAAAAAVPTLVSVFERATLTVAGLHSDYRSHVAEAVKDAAAANPWLCSGVVRDFDLYARRRAQWSSSGGLGPAPAALALEKTAIAKTLLRCARMLLFATSTRVVSEAHVQHMILSCNVWEAVLKALMRGWFLPRDINDVLRAMGDRRSIGRLLRVRDRCGAMEERQFVWRCVAFLNEAA